MQWGNKFVISVGGGKGGIGKSSFAGNLGVELAKTGKRVVVIDADLGAANLHTIIGIAHPQRTLKDFIQKRYGSLKDVLTESPYPNLQLLSSASDVLSLSYPTYKEKQRLFSEIQKLDTDIIIFDIAAGTNQRAIDFFTLAPVGIVLIQPIPTSLENAFSFLKNLVVRHLVRIFYNDKETSAFIMQASDSPTAEKSMEISDIIRTLESKAPEKMVLFKRQILETTSKFCVVSNNIKTTGQVIVAEKFSKIVKRYLSLNMTVLGNLPFEMFMDRAISERVPFVSKYPDSGYAKGVQDIAANIFSLK
jgi:flagellar biosynthesis protein FlhG